MLLEQQIELLTTTPYENYLDSGGRLPEEEYNLALEILSLDIENQWVQSYKEPSVSQILTILDACQLEAFPSEVLIYNVLRKRMSCDDKRSDKTDIRSKSVWRMYDRELVREIVFLTDETGEKYRIITETYPNIFLD